DASQEGDADEPDQPRRQRLRCDGRWRQHEGDGAVHRSAYGEFDVRYGLLVEEGRVANAQGVRAGLWRDDLAEVHALDGRLREARGRYPRIASEELACVATDGAGGDGAGAGRRVDDA